MSGGAYARGEDEHVSVFDSSSVRDSLSIAPGSGTGELANISGQASVAMIGQGPYEFTLSYELA